jgi:Dolichyl-phosphate-mannose-protein mannosyltransferase
MIKTLAQVLKTEILILIALGTVLFLTNPAFTIIDDEAKIVSAAGLPLRQTLDTFRRGVNVHEHPPLYDILLHGWLRLTSGNFRLLRLPAILFYLLGVWLLARAANEIAGERAAWAALWMGALWPFGFHYGRIAAWYSFCYLIVAALTLLYLRLMKRPSAALWFAFLFLAVALIYTNYFGWAFLACLACDVLIRRRQDLLRAVGVVFISGLFLAVAYVPLWRSFADETSTRLGPVRSLTAGVLIGGFQLYNAFVSESVAPWFWALSVPALLCISVVLLTTFFHAPWPVRRLLIYFLALLAVMTAIGIITSKRLLPEAAWLLLPTAVAASVLPRGILRVLFFAGLGGILLVGWFGIVTRRYYSAPRFIEPWAQVSAEAAARSRANALVVGNNPSFFFYLAYSLQSAGRPGSGEILKDFSSPLSHAPVFHAGDWLAQGEPLREEVFLVRGAPGPLDEGPAWDAQTWLDTHCSLLVSQQLLPDPEYAFKARFFPEGALPWRIQTRDYSCANAMRAPAR